MNTKVVKSGAFVFNSVTYGFTNIKLSIQHKELDVTDQNTTQDTKDHKAGRASTSFTVELWRPFGTTKPPLATEYSASLNFENATFLGTAILFARSEDVVIDSAVKTVVSGKFNGTVTESES